MRLALVLLAAIAFAAPSASAAPWVVVQVQADPDAPLKTSAYAWAGTPAYGAPRRTTIATVAVDGGQVDPAADPGVSVEAFFLDRRGEPRAPHEPEDAVHVRRVAAEAFVGTDRDDTPDQTAYVSTPRVAPGRLR